MGNWRVQSVESLCLFDQKELKTEQIKALPAHLLQQICEGLGRALDQVDSQLPLGFSKLSFSTSEEGRIFIHLDGDSIICAGTLQENPLLRKAMRKVVNAVNLLFTKPLTSDFSIPIPRVEVAEAISKPFFERISDEYNPSVISDVNSIARHSLTLAGKCASLVAVSGLLSGVNNLEAGARILRSSSNDYNTAVRVGDEEGKTTSTIDLAIGGTYGALGASSIVAFIPKAISLIPKGARDVFSNTPFPLFLDKCAPIVPFMAAVGSVASLAMSVFTVASVAHSWKPLSNFRDELKTVLKAHSNPVNQAEIGLRFLRDQFTLNVGELAELQLEHSSENYEQAIKNKLEEKWGCLKRRVGEDTASKIVKEVPELLDGIYKNDIPSIQKALDLLQEVDHHSFSLRVKQVMDLMISVFFVVIGIFALLSPAAPILPILFAIGAALWIIVDSQRINRAIGSLFFIKSI